MIRIFRYLLFFSMLLFLISSFFTGIKYAPIVDGTKIIDAGYHESFIFLVSGAVLLTAIYSLTFFIKLANLSKHIIFGISLCNGSMIAIAIVLIYCDYKAIGNNFEWGESALIWFLIAFPTTILFSIGMTLVFYGWYKQKKVK